MTLTAAYRPTSPTLECVLILDLGEVHTRVHLFDVVDGSYRFVSSAAAPTTTGAPFSHVGYGIRAALEQLGTLCGRTFLDEDGKLILPRPDPQTGVDGFALTFSLGKPLNGAVAGLHPAVSVAAALDLAQAYPIQIGSVVHPGDGLSLTQRLASWLACRPEIFFLSGGLDGGSAADLLDLADQLEILCRITSKEYRPLVFFAGNNRLQKEISKRLSPLSEVWFSPNLCPAEGQENARPSRARLAEWVRQDRLEKIPGLKTPDAWAAGLSLPSSFALGRTVRFLNGEETRKGVLGVDVGTSSVTLGAAWGERTIVKVLPKYERRESGELSFSEEHLAQVMAWLYLSIAEDAVRDYIYNKMLFPGSVPVGFKDLAIEHAWARMMLREAAQAVARRWSDGGDEDLLPPLEPLIAAGSVLTRAPDLAYSALMLLDGLQPTGMSTLMLDQQHLLSVLGAAASLNPTLTVQVLDSNAFLNLGPTVAPVCAAPVGTPLLRVRMVSDSGADLRLELKQGELKTLPLTKGEGAQLWLKPLSGADIGMGPGRGGKLTHVRGGALGVILDGRGRPFRLPDDGNLRRERFKQWLTSLRGETAC